MGCDTGIRFPQRRGFSSSLPHADRIRSPSSFLSSGYRELFRWKKSRDMKLTTHLHLVLELRTRGAIPPLPVHLNVVVFSTGTISLS
jgi:hypothetical protein